MKLLRRSLAAAAILLIVVYAGAIVWLVSHETRLVFEAGQPLGDLRPQPPFEQIDARGNNPSVGLAWVMRTAAAPETRPWVLFLHGNASTIGSRLNILHYERLRSLGLNVLAPEYRGYGGVAGVPSEAGLDADARAAYDLLRGPMSVPPERIVVYGWSLGSGVAVDLASQVTPAAVILEGAPDSIAAIGQERYPFFPVRMLIRNPFDSILKIDRVRAPKLFLHSPDDAIVPIADGRKLFDAAPQPKQWTEVSGGHIHASETDPNFFPAIAAFLKGIGSMGDRTPMAAGR